MKALELYECIKAEAISDIAIQKTRFSKARIALEKQKELLMDCFVSDENYTRQCADLLCFLAYTTTIVADNTITVDEFMAMSRISDIKEKTFDQFSADMKKIVDSNCRQKAIYALNKFKCKSTAARFLHFCATAALVDGEINSEEEQYLMELCQIVLNRFRISSYSEIKR